MTPEKLGPFLVEEVLGKGGMGTVYRGRDMETGDCVALKVLSPELADDEAFLQRFQEEVETLLELRHPNIVQLLSFGRQDDNFYFAMELVEGQSLYAMQKRGHHFSPAEAAGIAIDICEALRHSHNLGVVHRDLKPGNIIRSQTGEIKLADYGIAKRFGGTQMTTAGILGTAEYMAPEQAKGKPATIASDLYSLGAVIYSLVSGKPPFEEASPYKTLERVVNETPPVLSHVATGVPDDLSQIVDKLLRKTPEERFRSAQSVQTKLKAVLENMHQRAEMETSVISALDDDFDVPETTERTIAENETPHNAAMTIAEGSVESVPVKPQPIPAAPQVAPDAATVQEGTGQALQAAKQNRVIREQDYHERAVRTGKSSVEESEKPSSFITILMAVGFLLVIVASAYLVWERAIRQRTPEELWAQIEVQEDQPQHALDAIRKYLKLYPDGEYADRVARLERQARANQYRRQLSFRAGVSSDLLDVEKKFLTYTGAEAGTEMDRAIRLESLINYYSTPTTEQEELNEQTLTCLEFARVFYDKYIGDSKVTFAKLYNELQDKIQQADDLETAGKTKEAYNLRKSTLMLFGDSLWAQDLLAPIKKKVESQEQ